MLQEQYYVIERENDDSHPLFSWDQRTDEFGLGAPVECNEILKFRLGKPYPAKLKWVDYHRAPDPVISPRLAAILAPMNIYGIQLLPSVVRDPRDPASIEQEYVFLHVWNRIACLDKAQSEVDYLDDSDKNNPNSLIFGIDKFVLDESILIKIELEHRLIFELAEKTSILLIHQSLKDAIQAIEPKGIRFIPATKWNSDSTFD